MPPDDDARLRRWQFATVATLFVGYAGYYVCRSVLPVASPGMMNDPASGIDEVGYGRLVAVGIYLYAAGKLVNGVLTEYAGGRAAFLLGMALSAGLVLAFGLAAGLAGMLVIWGANRFVQSTGWVALVQVTGRWFPHRSLATVMGVLSLSYLFGDAVARAYLGAFAAAGYGWRQLFTVAAGSLGLVAVYCAVLLRASPRAVGLPEPPPPPGNVFGADHGDTRVSLRGLLGPLLASRTFWLVCLMNMGLTAIRETFNAWTPRYLEKGVGVSGEVAGLLSFVFPFAGAVACLAAGWGADRLRGRFGRLIVPLMVLTTAALVAFAAADLRGRPALALVLISLVALFVMGPYTYCSGVLALNLGGKRAAAASAGLIDAAGYLCGAVVAGEAAGHLVKRYGFGPLLDVLVGMAAATLVIAVVYWVLEERQFRNQPT
jgi:OPA family glycerol-3-phosphate transporter-like MFS transporter